MEKVASLSSILVAKKGQATPAVAHKATDQIPDRKMPGTEYYKSLTVKLDRTRYEALKTHGVKLDKKSQEIFVEALDLWLKRVSSID